jgi:hypothetical protein
LDLVHAPQDLPRQRLQNCRSLEGVGVEWIARNLGADVSAAAWRIPQHDPSQQTEILIAKDISPAIGYLLLAGGDTRRQSEVGRTLRAGGHEKSSAKGTKSSLAEYGEPSGSPYSELLLVR